MLILFAPLRTAALRFGVVSGRDGAGSDPPPKLFHPALRVGVLALEGTAESANRFRDVVPSCAQLSSNVPPRRLGGPLAGAFVGSTGMLVTRSSNGASLRVGDGSGDRALVSPRSLRVPLLKLAPVPKDVFLAGHPLTTIITLLFNAQVGVGGNIGGHVLAPCGGGGGGIVAQVIMDPMGSGIIMRPGHGSGPSVRGLPLTASRVVDGGDPGTGLVPPAPSSVVLDKRVQALGDADQCLPPRLGGFPAGLGKVTRPSVSPRAALRAHHHREVRLDFNHGVANVSEGACAIGDVFPRAALVPTVGWHSSSSNVVPAPLASPGPSPVGPQVPLRPLSLLDGARSGNSPKVRGSAGEKLHRGRHCGDDVGGTFSK